MKKILSVLLALATLCSLAIPAFADSWTCSECGTENTGDYCEECGTYVHANSERAVDITRSEEWFCLNCGKINGKKFCASCGSKRSEGMEGSIIYFGAYEQDNNTENGKEPIEWEVIKKEGNKVMLLSRYGLDAHGFDASKYQGWDKSEMRSWLNGMFLNDAFTAKEQTGIETTSVKTGNNADWIAFAKKKGLSYEPVNGGADTKDKVFLLSLEEAMEYGGYSTLADFYNNGTDKMKTVPTEYAIAQGAYQSDKNKLDGKGCCWWWLRSPGRSCGSASCVISGGSLYDYYVNDSIGSVRPAFWLNLDSADIF